MNSVPPTQLIPAPVPTRGFGGDVVGVPAPGAAWQEGLLCLPCCVVHFLWQMCIKPLFPLLSSCSVSLPPFLCVRVLPSSPGMLPFPINCREHSRCYCVTASGEALGWVGCALGKQLVGKLGVIHCSMYLCFDGAEHVGVDQGRVPAPVMTDSHLKAQVQVAGAGCSVHTMLSNSVSQQKTKPSEPAQFLGIS